MTLLAPGRVCTLPTVAARPGVAFAWRFDFADPLRGGGHGVVAQVHRGCARMIGLPAEAELHARLADDRGDDAELQVFAFEQRALLDVDL